MHYITFLKNWQIKSRVSLGTITNVFSIVILASIITILGLLGLLLLFPMILVFLFSIYRIMFNIIFIWLCFIPLFLSHPIYALIVLIGIFLNAAFFLFYQHIQFIALIYVIIYIGAISILFLFVLMMFNLKKLKTPAQIYLHTIPSFLSFCTLGIIFYLITVNEIRSSSNANFLFYIGDKALDPKYFITFHNSDILLFSHLFYTYYSYLFLLSGFLLFIAMIGAIVLALGITEKTLNKPEPKTYLKYYHFITKHEN